ncbi:MAG: RNA polymerase sigma factor [Chloroflexota bacterium]
MPDWSRHDDQELIKSAQNGNAEAFGEVYSRYAQPLFRFLYAHVDNVQDAEDLMADVFLRAWRALPDYRHQKNIPFYVFLFRIARNRLVDHYRRQSVRFQTISLFEDEQDADIEDVAQVVSTNLEHAEVRNSLKQLREEYRTILSLRFFSGLSPEETAQVMGKSIGAIRVLQHRALTALHKLLKGAEK